jgi:hypothetical protein
MVWTRTGFFNHKVEELMGQLLTVSSTRRIDHQLLAALQVVDGKIFACGQERVDLRQPSVGSLILPHRRTMTQRLAVCPEFKPPGGSSAIF